MLRYSLLLILMITACSANSSSSKEELPTQYINGWRVEKFEYKGMTYMSNHQGGLRNVTLDSLQVEKLRWELDYLNDEHNTPPVK